MLNYTRQAAIENVNTIDAVRSKIVRNRVFDCHLSPDWRQMAIDNTVSSDFDPCSSIVKSVFDCRLSCVLNVLKFSKYKIQTNVQTGLALEDSKHFCCLPIHVGRHFSFICTIHQSCCNNVK